MRERSAVEASSIYISIYLFMQKCQAAVFVFLCYSLCPMRMLQFYQGPAGIFSSVPDSMGHSETLPTSNLNYDTSGDTNKAIHMILAFYVHMYVYVCVCIYHTHVCTRIRFRALPDRHQEMRDSPASPKTVGVLRTLSAAAWG